MLFSPIANKSMLLYYSYLNILEIESAMKNSSEGKKRERKKIHSIKYLIFTFSLSYNTKHINIVNTINVAISQEQFWLIDANMMPA